MSVSYQYQCYMLFINVIVIIFVYIAGPHLVFTGLNIVEGVALLLTLKPFLTERKTPSEQLY